MPIQVTTVYTKERLLRFNNFVVRSKGWMWILMAACTLIVGAAYGLLLSLGERDRMVEWGFFFILFLDLFYFSMTVLLPRFTVKKAKNLDTSVQYAFDVDAFFAEAKNQYVDEKTTVKYTMLKRVVCRDGELYLLISSVNAYIVDVSALSHEDALLLKRILEEKLTPKRVKWELS